MIRLLVAKKRKNEKPNVAIDFDGTIVKELKYPEMGAPEPGAIKAIKALKALGYRILIHTCRLNGWKEDPGAQAAAVANHLTEHGVPYDELVLPGAGKPFAEYYVDNKGLRYNGDWDEVVEFITENDQRQMEARVAARIASDFMRD
jgi:adenylylsulfate kinase